VHEARDKADLRLGRTPTDEWEGRVDQQGPIDKTEDETEKGKIKFFRGNSKNFVVLSLQSTINNERNTIQHRIWIRCHDTYRWKCKKIILGSKVLSFKNPKKEGE